jgi:hypothetical protein
MARARHIAISAVLVGGFALSGRGSEPVVSGPYSPSEWFAQTESWVATLESEPIPQADPADRTPLGSPADGPGPSLLGDVLQASATAPPAESAQFPGAYQIPDTDVWWKFGGYIKGDFIHDFQPAGTTDRWVPTTIPTDGRGGDNTLMQAKATRLNLDVRMPSDWGIVRGFVETDFFTTGNNLRIRHAYVSVDRFLAGQTWTAFTDPNGIPRTLDFESPIAFITLRQAQFRWTQPIAENLDWVFSIENPTTSVDDIVTATIPGLPEQPLPDFVTHLKYTADSHEWFVAAMFRDLVYRPDVGSSQHEVGMALNLVGILYPTDGDKLIGQFVFGSGLGRYRSGSDLGLDTLTEVDAVNHVGGCVGITHAWTETLSSTFAYSFANRRGDSADPPETPRWANYLALNLIWEPIDRTSFGIEYLYGTNETQDDAFGYANRIQASVQYNFP